MTEKNLTKIPVSDTEFHDWPIERVERYGDGNGFTISVDGGLCLGIPATGIVPRVGQIARFYGQGFGYPVRGVTIDGTVIYYRSQREQAQHESDLIAKDKRKRLAEFYAQRAEREARYMALPPEFRARIDRFRAGSPTFQIEHEPYEVFCCEQAVAIFNGLKLAGQSVEEVSAKLNTWKELTWEQQKQSVPEISDGHSGNTFGVSMRLAYWYATKPENVIHEHGALAVLVGCEEYGCTHKEAAAS